MIDDSCHNTFYDFFKFLKIYRHNTFPYSYRALFLDLFKHLFQFLV